MEFDKEKAFILTNKKMDRLLKSLSKETNVNAVLVYQLIAFQNKENTEVLATLRINTTSLNSQDVDLIEGYIDGRLKK